MHTLNLKQLTLQDLPAIMTLQEKILEALLPHQKDFVVHRSEEDFKKLLTPPSGLYGCFDGDKLVAQMAYDLPSVRHAGTYPEFKTATAAQHLIIFEAILVDPAYRGHGLMQRMLAKVGDILHEQNPERTYAIMQIASANLASWKSALHYGMEMTKVAKDPGDSTPCFYLEKNMKFSKASVIKPAFYVNLENYPPQSPHFFQYMRTLYKHGYIGIKYDAEHNGIALAKFTTPSLVKVLSPYLEKPALQKF